MKLLILGGNGMAGHMLVDYFTRQGRFTVFYTTRDAYDPKGLVVDLHAVWNERRLNVGNVELDDYLASGEPALDLFGALGPLAHLSK